MHRMGGARALPCYTLGMNRAGRMRVDSAPPIVYHGASPMEACYWSSAMTCDFGAPTGSTVLPAATSNVQLLRSILLTHGLLACPRGRFSYLQQNTPQQPHFLNVIRKEGKR
jgi:hypothetical protein